jgi:hypothetical protein
MYVYTYIHTYMHACMHTYIHTYVYTYIHTHTHRWRATHFRQPRRWVRSENKQVLDFVGRYYSFLYSVLYSTLHSKCTRALDFVLFVDMFVGRDWHGSVLYSIFIIIHYDTDLVLFVGMFVGRGWHGPQSGWESVTRR